MTSPDLRLDPLFRLPGRRALAWHRGVLYASRGYALWRWTALEDRWELVARYRPAWSRRLSGASRLGARLRRDGFHSLAVLPDGGLLAVLPRAIALCPPGAREFEVTWRVERGTRPLNLALLPDGAVYWGEYFDNPRRESVRVYGSTDGGRTWSVAYAFEAGAIRHVHSITFDSYRNHLWMCTGDYGHESRVLRVAPDWTTVEPALAAGQQTRTVRPVPMPDGLYFATDSEREQNHLYRLTSGGTLERLLSTSGPSTWGCQVGSSLFFSTHVEPSRVIRERSARLYGSREGRSWSTVLAWRKDRWPMTLFQFGNIVLPSGRNDTDVLAVTGVAVEKEDGVLHAWRVSAA